METFLKIIFFYIMMAGILGMLGGGRDND